MLIADELLLALDKPNRDLVARRLKLATFVKIQNVADYLYQTCEQEEWCSEDYPTIAPPWPNIWFEWRGCPWILTDKKPDFECRFEMVRRGVYKIYAVGRPSFGALFESITFKQPAPYNVKWATMGTFFVPAATPPIIYGQLILVDSNGAQVELPNTEDNEVSVRALLSMLTHGKFDEGERLGGQGTILRPRIIFNRGFADVIARKDSTLSTVPLLALAFCNCRNVAKKKNAIPTPLIKKALRKGRVGFESFYTLEIEPMKRTLAESAGTGVSIQKRFHICRGHFKHFGEKKLFGKHEGDFWWPMHTRGSAMLGSIKKDYDIGLEP